MANSIYIAILGIVVEGTQNLQKKNVYQAANVRQLRTRVILAPMWKYIFIQHLSDYEMFNQAHFPTSNVLPYPLSFS